MLRTSVLLLVFVAVCQQISGEVYLEENFSDDSWKDSWVYSKHPGKEFGKFERSSGKFWWKKDDSGIQTTQDARFYALSKKFDKPFSNEGKELIVQFSVKHEQNIDCGGGYVKLFGCDFDPTDMHGETPYEIMFGPDICGPSTKKVHVILNYKGKNHMISKDIRCKDDELTHFYTFVLNPDNTYEVRIDDGKVEFGKLEDHFDFLPPKKIKDPNAKKPEDWDDRPTIPDPNDEKPEDWDKPEHIPDPDATKPEDWDDEMDGEWEPPMVDNPEYKGEWQPKQLDNPDYKGAWEHPEIDNPEYSADENLYKRNPICALGFDLWQVKSGTIFDNVLVTDDLEYSEKLAKKSAEIMAKEKKMKSEIEAEQRRKEEEEEAKKNAANTKEDDEDEDDDDNEPEPEHENNEIETGVPEVEEDSNEHDEL